MEGKKGRRERGREKGQQNRKMEVDEWKGSRRGNANKWIRGGREREKRED